MQSGVGPGTYHLPGTIGIFKPKPKEKFHGASSTRFYGNDFERGIGTGMPSVAPGSYEESYELRKIEAQKRKLLQEEQERVAFFKLRKLFPDKQSISTV